jgi:hypothetical protein
MLQDDPERGRDAAGYDGSVILMAGSVLVRTMRASFSRGVFSAVPVAAHGVRHPLQPGLMPRHELDERRLVAGVQDVSTVGRQPAARSQDTRSSPRSAVTSRWTCQLAAVAAQQQHERPFPRRTHLQPVGTIGVAHDRTDDHARGMVHQLRHAVSDHHREPRRALRLR